MSSGTRHIPVAIVGAGPVGLTLAIDLRLHGIEAGVFDEEEGVCDGSRAIAWAKRTLEIYDRLGLGHRMREKGTTWQHGKVFWETKLIYDSIFCPKPAMPTLHSSTCSSTRSKNC